MNSDAPILEARAVSKRYSVNDPLGRRNATVSALDCVSLVLRRNQTVALVGESGCGKSTLTRLLARLEAPTEGDLCFEGEALPRRVPRRLRSYSRRVQLILQDPYASLNPVHTVGYTLSRVLTVQTGHRSRKELQSHAAELLERVQLRPGVDFLKKYPHELSGGQRQRVAIARAIAAQPSVLLADEPVSMLDVSIRFGVLSLLRDIREESHLALLYVTHDIATARYFADRIVVLYAGRVVEEGDADEIVLNPKHPYTKMLIAAAPDPRRTGERETEEPLGEPPNPADLPSGCRFHPRCPSAMPQCSQVAPPLAPMVSGGSVACWLYKKTD